MVIEECAELIQALQKKKRYGFTKMRERVEEEIVDVYICLKQLKIIYGVDDSPYFIVKNYEIDNDTERLVVKYASKMINCIADGFTNEETIDYCFILFWYVRVLTATYFSDGDSFHDMYDKKLEALKNIMDNGIKEREI